MGAALSAWHSTNAVDVQSTQPGCRNGSPKVHLPPFPASMHITSTCLCSAVAWDGVPSTTLCEMLSLFQGTLNPCAKAGMKGPIIYHAGKGSVLRFLWGQGNAERQLPTQQDRVKLCSFNSLRMGTCLFRAAETAKKPCSVRIPEESSVHAEPAER